MKTEGVIKWNTDILEISKGNENWFEKSGSSRNQGVKLSCSTENDIMFQSIGDLKNNCTKCSKILPFQSDAHVKIQILLIYTATHIFFCQQFQT